MVWEGMYVGKVNLLQYCLPLPVLVPADLPQGHIKRAHGNLFTGEAPAVPRIWCTAVL